MANNIIMHQGESFAIPMQLTRDGAAITSDVLDELEVQIGNSIFRKLSDGGIQQISEEEFFYFVPEQKETLDMKPGCYAVFTRVKFTDSPATINIGSVGTITILPSIFKEEI